MSYIVLKQKLIEAQREIRILRWICVVTIVSHIFTLSAKILGLL